MLATYPELRELAGPASSSAFWICALAAIQCALALTVGNRHWWLWLPCAYLVGATIDHALWALIHECCHSLVFRSRVANRTVALIANVPLVIPGAMSFFKYHMLHHIHLGDMDLDAGVPGPTEARIVGRSSFAKSLWIAGFVFITGVVRPRRIKVNLLDAWTTFNILTQALAVGGLIWVAGPGPLKYLLTSTVFAIGLHPLGGRWVQEHFAFAPAQETYSYYGPLNRVSFNVGYHNEHHDLVSIPWMHLPTIRRIAPEFYDGLKSYSSWTGVLFQFVRSPQISLFSYIVRHDSGRPRQAAADPAVFH